MNTSTINDNLIKRICLNNEQALDFLITWNTYCHEIDDIIDGDRTTKEEILSTFAKAIKLYTHPFFLANILSLKSIALLVTNAYADSVAWEHSPEEWQRDWSSHYSHVAQEMMISIAQICGGYDHGRTISLELRNLCWYEHHKPNTKDRI